MDRRSRLPWATRLTWMEVDNILGRDNVYQYLWNPKTAEPHAVNQIGRFVVGGLTFEF